MNDKKTISYKIEVTSKDIGYYDLQHIYDEMRNFHVNTSYRFNILDSKTIVTYDLDFQENEIESIDEISNDSLDTSKKDSDQIIKSRAYKIHETFSSKKSFEKYINSLPKYYKRIESETDDYIKDYMMKNRSAGLTDILRGCLEQGMKTKASDPSSIIYKRLKTFIKEGRIDKKDEIYYWNYKE